MLVVECVGVCIYCMYVHVTYIHVHVGTTPERSSIQPLDLGP